MCIQSVMIIFSFLYPAGKAGESQIRRCQGIAVKCYGFNLGALTLTPAFVTLESPETMSPCASG